MQEQATRGTKSVHSELLEVFVATLEFLRERLAANNPDAQRPSSPPLLQREDLKKISDVLSKSITNFSLLFSDSKVDHEAVRMQVTVDKGGSLLREIEEALVYLVQAYELACCGSVPALRRILAATFRDVLERIEVLARAMMAGGPVPAPLTGRVWEACKVLAEVPLDNHGAACRECSLIAATVRDALEEFQEALNHAAQEDEENGQDEDEGDDDNDDDAGEEAGVGGEVRCAGGAGELQMKTALSVLQNFPHLLHADTPVDALEPLLQAAKDVAAQVDELACAFYSGSRQEVLAQARALHQSMLALLAQLRGLPHAAAHQQRYELTQQLLNQALDMYRQELHAEV